MGGELLLGLVLSKLPYYLLPVLLPTNCDPPVDAPWDVILECRWYSLFFCTHCCQLTTCSWKLLLPDFLRAIPHSYPISSHSRLGTVPFPFAPSLGLVGTQTYLNFA